MDGMSCIAILIRLQQHATCMFNIECGVGGVISDQTKPICIQESRSRDKS